MKSIYKLLIIALLFFSNTVLSQGCDVDDPTSTDSTSTRAIKIFGYIQPEYDYNFTEGDQDNTIRFKRARIGVRGKVLNDFSYYFMLEASPFIGGTADTYLMDAFVTYEADNWARFSVGTFKQPFSLDVATPCHMLKTIERSVVADQLVAPQRDFGLAVFGGNPFNKLNYSVAVMNGTGLNQGDNNTKKDIMGRATYKITRYLTIGGSFRFGYPIPNNNEDDRSSYGGEVLLELDKLRVQAEYIYDEGAYFAGAAGGCGTTPIALGQKRDGAYILATYAVNEKFEPIFKYEYLDPDIEVKNNIGYLERMTVGFNYFVNNKVRFQLNYLANIETVVNVDNDQLLAQVQIRF
ncbi:phosphate-selective porin [Jejuia pallidilutea]|uniref:Phosphate-selective porin n=1 Tax=Jejuia pallidilutea TaxID=504487 RepID=A0A362X5U2_9FLAO|nr:porin [Jejuia pallidilutea]PQV50391.1 phosphate-selective porin [Jejuia pallidilutea]